MSPFLLSKDYTSVSKELRIPVSEYRLSSPANNCCCGATINQLQSVTNEDRVGYKATGSGARGGGLETHRVACFVRHGRSRSDLILLCGRNN